MKNLFLFLFVLSFLSSAASLAYSQDQVSSEDAKTLEKMEWIIETPEEVVNLCNRFMDAIYLGEVNEAFELLEPYFPNSEESFPVLKEKTWKKLRYVDLKIGRMLGYDLVRQDVHGGRIGRFVYVTRYDDYMFQWTFIMMKPDKTWKVKSVSWDEKIKEIF